MGVSLVATKPAALPKDQHYLRLLIITDCTIRNRDLLASLGPIIESYLIGQAEGNVIVKMSHEEIWVHRNLNKPTYHVT